MKYVYKLGHVGKVALLAAICVACLSAQQAPAIVDVEARFTASGYMGDGEYGTKYIAFAGADRTSPHSPPTAIKVTYTFGPLRWAGMYWQNEPDNWGDRPGTDYSARGVTKLVFWAKGELGGEVVEFLTGGIVNASKKHRDSFREQTGRVTLGKEWEKFEIDLRKADLSSVIGGFAWTASADYNPGSKMSFSIDDIRFE